MEVVGVIKMIDQTKDDELPCIDKESGIENINNKINKLKF